jgi:hypothetical protein
LKEVVGPTTSTAVGLGLNEQALQSVGAQSALINSLYNNSLCFLIFLIGCGVIALGIGKIINSIKAKNTQYYAALASLGVSWGSNNTLPQYLQKVMLKNAIFNGILPNQVDFNLAICLAAIRVIFFLIGLLLIRKR